MAAKKLTSQLHSNLKLMYNMTCRKSRVEIAAKTSIFLSSLIKVGDNREKLTHPSFSKSCKENIIKIAGNFKEHVKSSSMPNKGSDIIRKNKSKPRNRISRKWQSILKNDKNENFLAFYLVQKDVCLQIMS